MAVLNFSRDTKVLLELGSDIWEIPVLDGFSLSQATNTSEVTIQEAAASSGASRRQRQMFNDSIAPAEWSFSTYMLCDTVYSWVCRRSSMGLYVFNRAGVYRYYRTVVAGN